MAADPGKPFEVPQIPARDRAEERRPGARRLRRLHDRDPEGGRPHRRHRLRCPGEHAELSRKLLKLAEENVAGAFQHAQELVRARDLQEMMKLQADFLKAQMASLGEQARVVSDAAAETASDLVDKARGKD